jgi:hypothetical protein
VTDWYFDHNVSQPLAALMRLGNHMVITARDIGLDAAGDQRHLLVAAQRGLILVTHNVKDFRPLHDAWLTWSNAWSVTPTHTGILIIPGRWEDERAAQELEDFIAQDNDLETGATSGDQTWDGSIVRRPRCD